MARWSAPTTASTATISAEGDTLVEFQVADNAGNVSDWSAPAEVRIDQHGADGERFRRILRLAEAQLGGGHTRRD